MVPSSHNFAFGIAPAAINHLVDGDLIDISRDHAIYEFRGVFSSYFVFVQRRISINAAELRMALYSCSWCISYTLTV